MAQGAGSRNHSPHSPHWEVSGTACAEAVVGPLASPLRGEAWAGSDLLSSVVVAIGCGFSTYMEAEEVRLATMMPVGEVGYEGLQGYTYASSPARNSSLSVALV